MKVHLYIILISIACVVSFSQSSCTNKKDSLDSLLLNMKLAPVDIDIVEYKNIMLSDSIPPLSSSHCKIVKYVDSTSCTSCVLQNLYLWNDLINLYKRKYTTIDFYFILSDKNYKEKDIITTLKNTGFNNSILLDTAGIFMKTNLYIPNESKCHTFFLDETNRVLLVGDPIQSAEIEQLYNRIIEEKYGENISNNVNLKK